MTKEVIRLKQLTYDAGLLVSFDDVITGTITRTIYVRIALKKEHYWGGGGGGEGGGGLTILHVPSMSINLCIYFYT